MNIKHLFPVLALGLGVLTSCNSESDIHAELDESRYNVEDSQSDPVQHERHILFTKYKTYLITNPQTVDYKFNFQKKNNLLIKAPEQTPALLQRGIQRLHEMFLDVYPEEFKQKHLPFSIIIADDIQFLGMEDRTPSYHAYAANRFLAMGSVRPTMGAESDSLKRAIKGEIHSRYWIDYLGNETKVFTVPESFVNISKDYYKKEISELSNSPLGDVSGLLPWQIDFHKLGFISYNHQTTFFDPDPDWGGWWIEAPDEDTDKRQWVAFIFSTPKKERIEIINSSELMKQKYDLLKAAFLACDNFDIDKLP